MKHARLFGYVMACLLALAASGCAEVIPYVPQPAKVTEPQHALEETVNVGLVPPLKVEVTDAYLKTIHDLGQTGLNTKVLRFASVGSMKLLKGMGIFTVGVFDASGGKIFTFAANDLATAQRFMDALEAARAQASKKP